MAKRRSRGKLGGRRLPSLSILFVSLPFVFMVFRSPAFVGKSLLSFISRSLSWERFEAGEWPDVASVNCLPASLRLDVRGNRYTVYDNNNGEIVSDITHEGLEVRGPLKVYIWPGHWIDSIRIDK